MRKGRSSANYYRDKMSSGMDKLPPYQGVTYRIRDKYRCRYGGQILVDRGFKSTTRMRRNEKPWDLQVIVSKTGRIIDPYSSTPIIDEREVLFKPGIKFKCVLYKIHPKGPSHFYLEEIVE